MTMPRPSLVTSSGPSPVRGFMAAMCTPLPVSFVRRRAQLQPIIPHPRTWPDLVTSDGADSAAPRSTRGPAGGPRMTEQAPGPVRYEVASGVATITLDRPEAMNGLDVATKEALLHAVRRAAG